MRYARKILRSCEERRGRTLLQLVRIGKPIRFKIFRGRSYASNGNYWILVNLRVLPKGGERTGGSRKENKMNTNATKIDEFIEFGLSSQSQFELSGALSGNRSPAVIYRDLASAIDALKSSRNIDAPNEPGFSRTGGSCVGGPLGKFQTSADLRLFAKYRNEDVWMEPRRLREAIALSRILSDAGIP